MLSTLIALSTIANPVSVTGHDVVYKDGATSLTGYVAIPDHMTANVPAVMIVHQWMGLTDYEKGRADQIAKLGYVAFACDIYGTGVRPANTQEAGAQAGKYKGNRELYRSRLVAGLKEMEHLAGVDRKHTAAIGYCFGGTGVIELARTGANIKGVTSFHGGLDSPNPADGAKIRCKVLVCAGADDPFESPKDLAAFKKEMADNKVDMKYIAYPGAVHSFTQPNAGNDNAKGAAYNAKADHESFAELKAFLAKIFK